MPTLDQPEQLGGIMSLGEHLEDLRRRVIFALIGCTIGCLIAFYFGREIVFLFQEPLARVLESKGLASQAFVFSPTGAFSVYMTVSLVTGVIISAPWVLYQLWKFVSVGLYSHERKLVYLLVPFSSVMMVLGLLFSYFIMIPVCLMFLVGWSLDYPTDSVKNPVLEMVMEQLSDAGSQSPWSAMPDQVPRLPVVTGNLPDAPEGSLWLDGKSKTLKVMLGGHPRILARLQADSGLAPMIGISEYISFAMYMTLGIVAAFQLPVAMLILGWTGLVDPARLVKTRKYAVMTCFVLGALLTPQDPLSMFLLAVPLYLQFEFGLFLMHRAYRRSRGRWDNWWDQMEQG